MMIVWHTRTAGDGRVLDALEGAAQEAAGALHEQFFVVACLVWCPHGKEREKRELWVRPRVLTAEGEDSGIEVMIPGDVCGRPQADR